MINFTYIYELECDEESTLIGGDHELDLNVAVKDALESVPDDADIISPTENWFEMLVSRICDRNNFTQLNGWSGCIDIETPYFDEIRRREDKEETAETECVEMSDGGSFEPPDDEGAIRRLDAHGNCEDIRRPGEEGYDEWRELFQ